MKELLFGIKYLNKISPKILIFSILIKAFGSFFNAFYGVYFLRIILYNLEAGASFWASFSVAVVLIVIETAYWYAQRCLFNIFNDKMTNKVNEQVLTDIAETVRKIPFKEFNKPETLDKASRISQNTSENLMKTSNAIAHAVSVIVDVAMISAYVFTVDPYALLISFVPGKLRGGACIHSG